LFSAGVPVLVTRNCSLPSSCFKEIFMSIWEIYHITIFFFMVCCRVAGLAYCLSLCYPVTWWWWLFHEKGNNRCFPSSSSGAHNGLLQ
jgi:hypothetical protein